MNELPSITHSRHRNMIAGWAAKGRSLHLIDDLLNQQQAAHSLKSGVPDFHVVAISFIELKDHPDFMRVHSTNWKAEDEPNGIFLKTDCRIFWRQLVKAGFVPF